MKPGPEGDRLFACKDLVLMLAVYAMLQVLGELGTLAFAKYPRVRTPFEPWQDVALLCMNAVVAIVAIWFYRQEER